MAKCEDCGEKFDSEQGLWIHRAIEHEEEVEEWEEGGIGETLVDAWNNPRYTLIFGFLLGLVLVAAVVVSSPAAFQGDPGKIGARTLNHYQGIAPPGVEYSLVGVEKHDSGMYAVTLQVASGSRLSNETVYVTQDGDHVFESPPSPLEEDISALGR